MNGQRRRGACIQRNNDSATKRNEIGLFVETWMDLVSVIQNEAGLKEKNKYLILTHICGIQKKHYFWKNFRHALSSSGTDVFGLRMGCHGGLERQHRNSFDISWLASFLVHLSGWLVWFLCVFVHFISFVFEGSILEGGEASPSPVMLLCVGTHLVRICLWWSWSRDPIKAGSRE